MIRAISTSYGTQPFAFEAKTDFREGLKRTIEWYITEGRQRAIKS